MQNYGKQIKWSTVGAPNPAGGLCENYSYQDRVTQDDHEADNGDHAATVIHDRQGSISFATKLTDDATVPVMADNAGCKIAITGIATGGVLLSQVVESWALKAPRRLQVSATHYPDLTAGGSDVAADLTAIDEITTPPIVFPGGRLAWGTKGVSSALGIVQGLTITQSVRHSPESEEGKIVCCITSLFQMSFQLQVLALAAAVRPATGQELALTAAPGRFKTGNFIVDASERYRGAAGTIFDITARWAPSLAA